VLILVLIVVAMLALGGYAFTNLMLAHHEAAVISGKQAQARSLVDSGVTAVQLFLSQAEADRVSAGGVYDNAQSFRGKVVLEDDDPNGRGYFSLVSPNVDSEGNATGVRYGLDDESTRLNLNVLLIADKTQAGNGRKLLMALPNMTEDVADAILDWLDPDDEQRELGAEVAYYSGLEPAYGPKNGPVDTVEELLLVRGVTPALLFGADSNRNGQLDQHEMLDEFETGASTDPNAFRGWSQYLTIYSVEWNITPEGTPKAYLNNNDLNKLVEDLEAAGFAKEWIDFIVAYRQVGLASQGSTTPTVSVSTQSQTGELNMTLPAQTPIGSVLDLVGAQVQYTYQGAAAPTTLTSPFAEGAYATYISQLMDYATVNPSATIPGRININQCSAQVLNGIPGMNADLASKILAARTVDAASADPARKYETWILTEGLVTLAEMKVLMPFINGGGSAYRGQIVGYLQGGQASARVEVVFDATSPLPRLLLWRDLTHLGRGYTLDALGVSYGQ